MHHHCAASAFQSATDEHNEINQDGLHLTVGRMDAEQHELHARFYLDGNCYEPEVAALLPESLHHEIARHQMGRKVTVDFPDAWRANLVEVAPERTSQPARRDWELGQPDWGLPRQDRVDEALEKVHRTCAANGVAQKEWLEALQAMAADETMLFILEVCLRYGIRPEELLIEIAQAESGF